MTSLAGLVGRLRRRVRSAAEGNQESSSTGATPIPTEPTPTSGEFLVVAEVPHTLNPDGTDGTPEPDAGRKRLPPEEPPSAEPDPPNPPATTGPPPVPPERDRSASKSPRPKRRAKRVHSVEPTSVSWVMTSPGRYIRVENTEGDPSSSDGFK